MSKYIFLQALGGEGGGGLSMIVLFLGMMIIFYFFMILPQMKKQKKEKQFREGLKKDDKVITVGGVYGKIVGIDDQSVMVEIDTNVKVKYEKTAIKSYVSS